MKEIFYENKWVESDTGWFGTYRDVPKWWFSLFLNFVGAALIFSFLLLGFLLI
ncbi:MAG: hypothetical protein AABY22_16510 [Nanoarchaeota archaeon]